LVALLPQLRNAETYRACEWDLKADPEGRQYWVALFCDHLEMLAGAIAEEYPETPPDRLAAFRSDYIAAMRGLDAEPERFARIDILLLDELRNDLQNRYGFHDPYRGIKARENELALAILPELLTELDASPAVNIVDELALGLMAGNVFDLGAWESIERCRSGSAEFRQLRATQPSRPWLIDSLDAWRQRWMDGPAYRHVAFFVDNAGSDICLGCLPLVRWMLRQGSRVTLVANSQPALNDVTAPELGGVLAAVGAADNSLGAALTDGRLSTVASGGRAPLLDLTQLADACVAGVYDADLVILHGMGRAIESNFRACFSCDSLRAAVLKDSAVARRVGGCLFDCVFWYEPAT
jgi:uncharacterized protein with ATP-grasp and redox domains